MCLVMYSTKCNNLVDPIENAHLTVVDLPCAN